MSLTIEEFRRLPRDERYRRYVELSPHDKYIARIEDWSPTPEQDESSEEAFLKDPPNGWEAATEEVLDKWFPKKPE